MAAPSLCLRLYSGLAEVLPEEGDDLFPAVGRGFLVVAGPIYCEESVAGSGVHVKLIVLVQTLELRLSLGDVGWGRGGRLPRRTIRGVGNPGHQ